jgi:hypothetical protein
VKACSWSQHVVERTFPRGTPCVSEGSRLWPDTGVRAGIISGESEGSVCTRMSTCDEARGMRSGPSSGVEAAGTISTNKKNLINRDEQASCLQN